MDLRRVQNHWPVTRPLCGALKGGLYEVRTDIKDRTARLIFCFHGKDLIVVLHGFIKKTQKTSQPDLTLARKRQADLKKE